MMARFPRRQFGLRSVAFAAGIVGAATALAASPDEAPFLAENNAAMAKMMAAMEIKPSGDIDRDFVAMMAPHHQGAIDMAQAELRYGHNEQLRRMAQEIIVTQQQEIAAMRLAVGQPLPANLSPLYHGELLVHGMGFSPDHRTIAVESIGSNSVTFIDTATNAVKHVAYVGRSPHEAFFTPDGKEVWVTVRGENYVSVLDATTYTEKTRIIVPNGPGMTIFSPDGKYGYVCSSYTPETVVISVADHQIVGRVPQASPFCPNIAATPDGKQVWFTLKDTGKTEVFDARPPFSVLKTIDTGPITNHVNIAHNANGTFAYVTVGGLNEVQVFRTDNFSKVATIPVVALPHGLWPSGDGTRIYVGLENGDRLVAIDTLTNQVMPPSPIAQCTQPIPYVPNAVPNGNGTQGLEALGIAEQVTHLSLVPL